MQLERSLSRYAATVAVGARRRPSANVHGTPTGKNLRAREMPDTVVTVFLREWTYADQ